MRDPIRRRLLSLTFLLAPAATAATAMEANLSVAPGVVAARVGRARHLDLPHRTDSIRVRLRSAAEATAALPAGAARVFGRWYTVPVAAGETVAEAVARWSREPAVELVELGYTARPFWQQAGAGAVAADEAYLPNDPHFGVQWHLGAVQAPEAWDVARGAGVEIALVDTGVARGGQDLLCRTFVDEYDAFRDLAGPSSAAADTLGHGTHVAGTLAQCTGNGVGLAGMAFEATLMPVQAANPDDANDLPDAAIARGIVWAADHGARVINLSVGTECLGKPTSECSSSLLDEAIAYAVAKDVVLVAAGGNAGSTSLAYPANHGDVIAVGATDREGVAPYSNHGVALDLVAPGGNGNRDADGDGRKDVVFQETLGSACGAATPYAYCGLQGTSYAVPHVAGAAALLRSHRPEATAAQVRRALEESAADLGVAGWDAASGHGALRARDALARLDALLDDGTGAEPPPPPDGPWIASPAVPGFRVKVRITAGTSSRLSTPASGCLAATLCAAGAIPGQAEVLLRVTGTKPNGHRWATLVRFSTSRIEVWIEQPATGIVRYYDLPALATGSDELPGLVDRLAF
jgi:subtilisin family serine protease